MKKRIYIIRHGQTDYNLKRIVQGRKINSNINTTGQAQAQKFFQKYKDISFDMVYTSLLKRTHQTVAPFLELGLPMERRAELDEISWGKYEGEKHDFLEDGTYKRILDSWTRGELHNRVEGGESPLELHARQKPLIEEFRKAEFAQNLLVCTHGRAMRALLCGFLNLPLEEMDRFSHSNTCLYVLSIQNGQFEIEISNDTSHLEE